MLYDLFKVNYQYADGNVALRNVSFSVRQGESIAILGANGSGKSTLLRLLGGLQFASTGKTLFRAESMTEASFLAPDFRAHFRQSVGFVFQNADAQLFNSTVFEEVAFGPRQLGLSELEVELRAIETLGFLGISHLADRAPFRLSGGEKRKVAIASVMSMNPQVLLFDEPFLGLDPRGQMWLIRTLQQLQGAGKTTIVATHSMDTVARIAKSAIVISETHEVIGVGAVPCVLSDRDLLYRANLIERESQEHPR